MLTSASLQPQYKCYFISSRHKSTSTKDTDVQNIKTKIGHKLQNNNNRAIKKKAVFWQCTCTTQIRTHTQRNKMKKHLKHIDKRWPVHIFWQARIKRSQVYRTGTLFHLNNGENFAIRLKVINNGSYKEMFVCTQFREKKPHVV